MFTKAMLQDLVSAKIGAMTDSLMRRARCQVVYVCAEQSRPRVGGCACECDGVL
jgi:hypothetical protein